MRPPTHHGSHTLVASNTSHPIIGLHFLWPSFACAPVCSWLVA